MTSDHRPRTRTSPGFPAASLAAEDMIPPESGGILLVAQRLDGVEPGGPHGRVAAEDEPDRDRDADRERDRPERDDRAPARVERDPLRDREAHGDPEQAAGDGDREGLEHDL